jgi:hypothetical protein
MLIKPLSKRFRNDSFEAEKYELLNNSIKNHKLYSSNVLHTQPTNWFMLRRCVLMFPLPFFMHYIEVLAH